MYKEVDPIRMDEGRDNFERVVPGRVTYAQCKLEEGHQERDRTAHQMEEITEEEAQELWESRRPTVTAQKGTLHIHKGAHADWGTGYLRDAPRHEPATLLHSHTYESLEHKHWLDARDAGEDGSDAFTVFEEGTPA